MRCSVSADVLRAATVTLASTARGLCAPGLVLSARLLNGPVRGHYFPTLEMEKLWYVEVKSPTQDRPGDEVTARDLNTGSLTPQAAVPRGYLTCPRSHSCHQTSKPERKSRFDHLSCFSWPAHTALHICVARGLRSLNNFL